MTDTSARPQRPAPGLRARARNLPPWSLLVTAVLAGGLAGGGYGALNTPSYSATSYVVAVPEDTSDPTAALGFAQAYGKVATQLAVLGDAQVWAGVPARTLKSSVTTATSPDAPMVSVTATSHRRDLAVDMADAVARALTAHADGNRSATHVELRQFARATKPTEPSSAGPATTGLVGAAAGGLLGGLALLVRPRRQERGPDGTRENAAEPGSAAAVPGPAVAADLSGRR
ncbi:lipopolysaccharide biosynthesis protein [Streptomyces sp. NPDC091377]|uniref:lipopolysaccharide biosynthesis protein n=1 Tax=Streptomyces sp. NPDC091377 TaxID=3365995 RepID=UPI0037F4ED1B